MDSSGERSQARTGLARSGVLTHPAGSARRRTSSLLALSSVVLTEEEPRRLNRHKDEEQRNLSAQVVVRIWQDVIFAAGGDKNDTTSAGVRWV